MARFRYFSPTLILLLMLIAGASFSDSIPGLLQFHHSESAMWGGFAISLIGIVLFVAAKLQLGNSFSPCSSAKIPEALVTQGVYSRLRHPIYTANLIFVLGLFISTGSLFIGIALFFLFYIYSQSIPREEEGLSSYLPQYREYQNKTPKWLPTFGLPRQRIYYSKLTGMESLESFSQRFSEEGGVQVSLEYLSQAHVIGFKNKFDNRLLAGFVVNCKPPLRYFQLIPIGERSELKIKNFREEDFCEITCIWMDRQFRLNKWEKFIVYFRCLIDASLTTQKFVLGGTNNLKILKIQQKILPNILWHGNKAGATYKVWVYYGHRSLLLFRIFFVGLPLELMRRSELFNHMFGNRSNRQRRVGTH